MKINDQENINQIYLTHKGCQRRFKCYNKPLLCNPFLEYLNQDNIVEITFDDLKEVESLINILERFKEETERHIGIWK